MKRERVAVASGAVFCAAAFLLGTVLAGEAPVKLTDALSLGQAIQADNVTAWPLFSNQPVEKLTEYVTLAEAQDKKQAEVREVGARQPQQGGNAPAAQQEAANQAQPSAENRQQAQGGQQMSGGGATVNTLVIENKGALPILVLAGTLLKGGQQDRQIAQDFIVAPSQTVPVDAFCVEHGRWTASRD
ncbi:MAG: hypothetical protein NTW87_15090, partial [Planctomycetota bacterium]|nr:hypothetical protein [Planctomycetota bacterium]